MSSRLRQGFTLIEVMIVVFIIGIIVLAISINFGPRMGLANSATRVSHRLQQYVLLLQDLAVFRNQQYGLRIANNNLTIYRWEFSCKKVAVDCPEQGRWQVTSLDNLIRVKNIDPRFRLQLFSHDTTPTPSSPQVVFYTSGEVTPFTLELHDNNNKPYYRLQTDATGELEIIDLGRAE